MRFVATVVLDPERMTGSKVELTGDLYRHLFRSRRLTEGEPVRAVDGLGGARAAAVARIDRDRAELRLGDPVDTAEPALRVELWVAAPKAERAAWLVEKATELGVEAVRWLRSERAPRRYGETLLARQRRVAVSALQQCGGARLPEISGPHEWGELPPTPPFSRLLDPGGPVDAGGVPAAGRAALMVGPEGGFTDVERESLQASGSGSWSLGERILRVETAALVGAATLLALSRDAVPGS